MKSRAYKALENLPEEMASNFILWVEHRGEPLTHAGLAHYLMGFIGFATAQAASYADLRDAEKDELWGRYSAISSMVGVHSRAEGPLVPADEMFAIARDMDGYTFGFGMDAASALGTFLEQRKRKYNLTKETLGGALISGFRKVKSLWPGGPAFERPPD